MGLGFGVSPPVKEGETYDVTIEDIGKEGDGVAKIENFVVFIPDTKVGDEVEIKITKVLRTLAFGEVVGEGDVSEDEEAEEVAEEEPEEEEVDEEEEEDIDTIEL
ncbi:MAG: TRAM domain-containing protein [Thermoplasmata archaeon]